MIVRVVIAGEPHAQMRPRTRVIVPRPDFSRVCEKCNHAPSTGEPFATIYDPPESEKWKKSAAKVMAKAMAELGLAPLTGALHVRILAVFELAKSHHRKRPVPRSDYVGTKDWENVAKAVCDAANGVLYVDDRQIARSEVRCIVGAQGEAPCVIIRVDQVVPAEIGRWDELEGSLPAPKRVEPPRPVSAKEQLNLWGARAG